MKTKIDFEGIGLKNFTLASEEEKKEFAKELHPNNEKWQNDDIKENYFFETLDGYIIALATEKSYKIHKDLWYDDETPTPDKTKKYFIDYNLRMHAGNRDEYLENSYKCYIQPNYDFNIKNACVNAMKYPEDYDKRFFIRELTEEEKQEYIKIIKVIKLRFIERLSKYFDRYNKNIYCIGYWANR